MARAEGGREAQSVGGAVNGTSSLLLLCLPACLHGVVVVVDGRWRHSRQGSRG